MNLSQTRQAARRQRMIDIALEHAVVIMTERGVGGLTVSEVARRIDVQPPSLYKYFTSLHAIYDALFARGTAGYGAAVEAAITGVDGWEPRPRAGVWARCRLVSLQSGTSPTDVLAAGP